MAAGFEIRSAKSSDAGLILSFIKALAEYEKLSHEVTATEEDLRKNLFEHKYAEVVIGYHKDSDECEEGMFVAIIFNWLFRYLTFWCGTSPSWICAFLP